jgi:Raf kinase inhibitor-like YbhB/YbcL family protein
MMWTGKLRQARRTPAMKFLTTLALAFVLVTSGAAAAEFKLASTDLASGQFKPHYLMNDFGCTGANVSPALSWTGAPENTKSFAVALFDRDAGSDGWWHWVVFDIPATVHELPTGSGDPSGRALPAGAVQSRNDFGTPGYGGPCPPSGEEPHRYIFTVYALDLATTGLDAKTASGRLGSHLNAHAIAKATLELRYGR